MDTFPAGGYFSQITTRKLVVHGLIMQWPAGQLVIQCVADELCNMGGWGCGNIQETLI